MNSSNHLFSHLQHHHQNPHRRDFIKKMALFSPMAVMAVSSGSLLSQNEIAVEGTAIEDLMGEHGALSRILLIYEDCLKTSFHHQDQRLSQRLSQGQVQDLLPDLREATLIVRDFIQNHHEKDEENDIFPVLEKAGKLQDLVSTLRVQHDRGRKAIAQVLELTDSPFFLNNENKKKVVASSLQLFIKMYRPHAAREDTIVYPVFKETVSPQHYQEIKEKFEELEHRLFGEEGIKGIINRIEKIEDRLGILDLKQYTF